MLRTLSPLLLYSHAKLRFQAAIGLHTSLGSSSDHNGGMNQPSRQPIVISDSDLEETFIHGWGPGGQAINKTANCVRLKHIPTGISVKCQDGRDLQANRHIARKRLIERLDEHFNGEASVTALRRKESQAKENNRIARAKRRLEMKAAFKKNLHEHSDDGSGSGG